MIYALEEDRHFVINDPQICGRYFAGNLLPFRQNCSTCGSHGARINIAILIEKKDEFLLGCESLPVDPTKIDSLRASFRKIRDIYRPRMAVPESLIVSSLVHQLLGTDPRIPIDGGNRVAPAVFNLYRDLKKEKILFSSMRENTLIVSQEGLELVISSGLTGVQPIPARAIGSRGKPYWELCVVGCATVSSTDHQIGVHHALWSPEYVLPGKSNPFKLDGRQRCPKCQSFPRQFPASYYDCESVNMPFDVAYLKDFAGLYVSDKAKEVFMALGSANMVFRPVTEISAKMKEENINGFDIPLLGGKYDPDFDFRVY
jgi:hypothetical protein